MIAVVRDECEINKISILSYFNKRSMNGYPEVVGEFPDKISAGRRMFPGRLM